MRRDSLWQQVRSEVCAHLPYDAREVSSRLRVLIEMERLRQPFDQDSGSIHITGSAIVTGSRGLVLHRHRRLGLWLQPGGHLEAGESPPEAALREAREETGLKLRTVDSAPRLFHIDVHHGGRGHTHLDLRYVFLAESEDPAPPPGESQQVHWFTPADALRIADAGLRGALLKLAAQPAVSPEWWRRDAAGPSQSKAR